jgi:hypothetical protein
MSRFLPFSLLLVSVTATANPWLKRGNTWHAIDFACELPDDIVTMDGTGGPSHPQRPLIYHGASKLDSTNSISLSVPFSVAGANGCGAGHCFYEFPNGTYTYRINVTSPGIVDTSLGVGSVRVTHNGKLIMEDQCRLVPHAIAQCITEDRAVYVVDSGGGAYSYEDFDFAGDGETPDLTIHGGTLIASGTSNNYSFVNRGYTYQLRFATATAASGFGQLVVQHNGKELLVQDCITYTAP